MKTIKGELGEMPIESKEHDSSSNKGEEDRLFHGIASEIKALLKLCLPLAVTNTLQFLVLTISVIMSGRLRKVEMDAVSLANSFINGFGVSPGVGLCTACDTLFSQSFGSSNKMRTGMWLQKGFYVLNSFVFVLVAFHMNFEPILIGLGQDPIVSRLTGRYMAIYAPGIILQWNYLILARYLQTQNQSCVPMLAGVLGNIFNAVSQYILIIVMGYGYEMSAYCQAATYGVMLLTEIVYIFATKFYRATWNGFKREAVTEWGEFALLAIAGVGHVTMEAICWEIGTFVAGYLGTTELATQAVLFQTETVLIMVAQGTAISVNIRIGQFLGGNKPKKAKKSLIAGCIFMLVLSSFFAIILITCRDYLPMIFTTHQDVILEAAKVMPLMGFFIIVDSMHTIGAGGLRGCGRQNIGAAFIIIGFYVLGEPIGISLALTTPLKVIGLWMGVLIGLSVILVAEFTILYKQDWQKQADDAERRVNEYFQYQSEVAKKSRTDETKSLLSAADNPRRRRTATEPRGCSMDFAKMSTNSAIPREKFIKLVIRRIVIYAASISFLIIGVCVHFYLPEELYWPSPWNQTLIENMTFTGSL